MLLRAYTVYDAKSLAYNTPFFAPTDGSATRSFQELANDLSTTVGKFPTDYSLWFVGTYDDQKGALVPVAPLVHVADANALVQRQPRLPIDLEANIETSVTRPNGEAR